MGRTPAGQTRERVFRLVRERLLSGAPPTVQLYITEDPAIAVPRTTWNITLTVKVYGRLRIDTSIPGLE